MYSLFKSEFYINKKKEEMQMIIANEGKKNLEAKANFLDPRGGCGCATAAVMSMTRDSVCTCACGSSGVLNSAKNAGKNA